MKRRDVLKSMGAVAASSALGACRVAAGSEVAAEQQRAQRPNILVFLTDDHGQWLQQAYGNSEVHTPNMSRIARNGVLMRNAFTTCPVCSPARASFFTGRMPSQHGIHDWLEESVHAYDYPWLKGQTLISEPLKDVGYHTGLVGKWHCGEGREPHRGFDYWFSYWVSQRPHRGGQDFSDNGKELHEEGFQSPFLTERAIEFLHSHYNDKALAEKPFFLFVGYVDTHSPHTQMPDDLVAEYKEATFRDIPCEKFLPVHGTAITGVSSDPKVERTKHEEYYASASSVDREVGKVLDELESMGKLEDTLVVYTGDHGLNAGQHGIWEKGNGTVPQNFFEESIRIACAISWPAGGIACNLESELPINHCDTFQTLLEIGGAVPDAELAGKINSPGRSYLGQLRGEPSTKWKDSKQKDSEWKDSVILEYGNARMIRKDSYKLILRYPFEGVNFPNELYDLKADPRETTNLYEEPQQAQRIKDLTAGIDEFFAKYTVPGHSGLDLAQQPMATPQSPWLRAVSMQKAKGAAGEGGKTP
ncbi:MAG TPA: sulfatase-like hydrolase/transferase [Terracidiphilus sp.]|nr:sulfatase-like hydrolase/transferase [Terracidiphilus sp.]